MTEKKQKCAATLLQEWYDECPENSWYEIDQTRVILGYEDEMDGFVVVVYSCMAEKLARESDGDVPEMEHKSFYATAKPFGGDGPADLKDMILMALEKWKEIIG